MLPDIALSSRFLFLMSLAYKSRLHIPFILAVLFLAFDIRLQLEVNINLAMRENEEIDFDELRAIPDRSGDEIESLMDEEEEGREGDDEDDDDDSDNWNARMSDDSTDIDSSEDFDDEAIAQLGQLLDGLPSELQLDAYEDQVLGPPSPEDNWALIPSSEYTDSDTFVDDEDMDTSSLLSIEDAHQAVTVQVGQAPKEQPIEQPKDQPMDNSKN